MTFYYINPQSEFDSYQLIQLVQIFILPSHLPTPPNQSAKNIIFFLLFLAFLTESIQNVISIFSFIIMQQRSRNLLRRVILSLDESCLASSFPLAAPASPSDIKRLKHPILFSCLILEFFCKLQLHLLRGPISRKTSKQLFISRRLLRFEVILITEEEIRFCYNRPTTRSYFITGPLSLASCKFQ